MPLRVHRPIPADLLHRVGELRYVAHPLLPLVPRARVLPPDAAQLRAEDGPPLPLHAVEAVGVRELARLGRDDRLFHLVEEDVVTLLRQHLLAVVGLPALRDLRRPELLRLTLRLRFGRR